MDRVSAARGRSRAACPLEKNFSPKQQLAAPPGQQLAAPPGQRLATHGDIGHSQAEHRASCRPC